MAAQSVRADEERLLADMIELPLQQGRHGYSRNVASPREARCQINNKRVECQWLRERVKVPMKQPERGRPWLNDGSSVRLRAAHRDHFWH